MKARLMVVAVPVGRGYNSRMFTVNEDTSQTSDADGAARRVAIVGSAVIWVALWIAGGRTRLVMMPTASAFRLYLLVDALTVYASATCTYASARCLLSGFGAVRGRLGTTIVFVAAYAPVLAFSGLVLFHARLNAIDATILFSAIAGCTLLGGVVLRAVFRMLVPTAEPQTEHWTREDAFQTYGISNREREVVDLMIRGKTNQEIAEALFISLATVKSHVASVFRKVGARNRTEVARVLGFTDQPKD